MIDYIDTFEQKTDNVKIVSPNDEIQDYFNKCDLMVTDYSSVAFDFAYLRKPIIYYQFDYDEYRNKQLQEGYYDYRKDGFGPVVRNIDDALKATIDVLEGDTTQYVNRMKKFFSSNDRDNCKRVMEAISE